MSLLAYKLRRTLRVRDLLTIALPAILVIVLACMIAFGRPWPWGHEWGLFAVAVMFLGIAARFFWARWVFWRRVEYVTGHGLAVMCRTSDIKWAPGRSVELEQRDVEDVTEAVVRWWLSDSRDAALQRIGGAELLQQLSEVYIRRALSRCLIIWQPWPFEDRYKGRFRRWVVGLTLGEIMQVSWKPDVWATELWHEMGHSILHLCCDFYGEQRVHRLFNELGYTGQNVRAG